MILSLRTKLLLLVAALLAVALAAVGATHLTRQRLHEAADAEMAARLQAGQALGRLRSAVEALPLLTRLGVADLATSAPERVAADRRQRDLAMVDLSEATAAYGAAALQAEDHGLWRDLAARLATLRADDDLAWAAIGDGELALARLRLPAAGRAAQEAQDAAARLAAAHSPARELAAMGETHQASDSLLLAGLLAATLALGLVGWAVTNGVGARLAALQEAAAALARGELDVQPGAAGDDELGLLSRALGQVAAAQREAAGVASAAAEGRLDVTMTPRGPRDGLASALAAMGRTLRETAQQAGALAAGELGAEVVPRGQQDALGAALRHATTSLREVAAVAERVARGDLEVTVAPKGPGDRLAGAVNAVVTTLRGAAGQANVIAGGDYSADVPAQGDRDVLGLALQRMTKALRDAGREARETDWLKSGVAKVNDAVLGLDQLQALATAAVKVTANHLGAKVGAAYVLEQDAEGPVLRLLGSYAFTQRRHLSSQFRLGEGLVGQAALEQRQIVLEEAPVDYVHVASGLGDAPPRSISVVPLLFKGELRGVLELGTLTALGPIQQQFLDQAAVVIGVAFEIARNQSILAKQQEELQTYTEELQEQKRALQATGQELQAQQVELEQSNTELEAQMQRTQESELRLKVQQRELEVTNRELEDRNQVLERQKAEIELARRELSVQAEELATASRYKSEFLANMSHELRTPLNSLLLLARSLRDDPTGNLTADQGESARVIYDSGSDLLNLINEILDLAKIEAGRMELRLEPVELAEVARVLPGQFGPMARSQGLALEVRVEPGAPERIVTDPGRLGQVLKNLLGNALKFTDRGGVTVTFGPVPAGADLGRSGLEPSRAFVVRIADTGIGIPLDKQRLVFEAFQQAESGDRRRYGGTGLGLSISREIVALLGGEIRLESQPGVGSTFTLLLPVECRPSGPGPGSGPGAATAAAPPAAPSARPAPPTPFPAGGAPAAEPPAPGPGPQVPDDRDLIEDHDRTILIIEDDARFCGVLVEEVRRRGFKVLAALRGRDGVALARAYRPSGVILDLHLPDTDGWAVLTELKQDVDTRHVPVHIVSAEEASLEGLRIGAIGHAHKPLRPEDVDGILAAIEHSSASAEKHVLVVEDDPVVRRETVRIVGNGNVHTQEVGTGQGALELLRHRRFDLVVLDLGLPDMQGMAFLEAARAAGLALPPVIVYTVRELSPSEELALRQYADSIIIKDVRSQERLIDEVALFLHRVVNDLPAEKRQAIQHLRESGEPLRGKKVLVVEDDMRTMFAMVKLLAGHGLTPLKAADGQQALEALEADPGVDLVLLDMMMPVMDGYETARRIRQQARFAALPVIALTAKAMKEDRQRCVEAGATDYLTKPVDQDRLISLLRVWLCR